MKRYDNDADPIWELPGGRFVLYADAEKVIRGFQELLAPWLCPSPPICRICECEIEPEKIVCSWQHWHKLGFILILEK